MNSQTENFKQVEKSTAECESFNAANKGLIDLGIELPLRPTPAILQKEEEERRKAALAIGEEKRFEACCEKFWKEVKKLLPESAQKESEIKGKFFLFSNGANGAEVSVYTSYSSSWHSTANGRTLRIERSRWGDGRKKIFKSKTQDIGLLYTETETIKKVAEMLSESHRIKSARDEAGNAAARRSDAGKKAHSENRATFDSLGISAYSLTGENGIFQAKLTIEATIEQWKAIAEILKERNQPK